jgi:hypothetical protein
MEYWPTELASTCAGVSGVSSGGGTDSGTAAEARRVQSWVQKYECHLVTSRTKYMLRHVLHTLNTCVDRGERSRPLRRWWSERGGTAKKLKLKLKYMPSMIPARRPQSSKWSDLSSPFATPHIGADH